MEALMDAPMARAKSESTKIDGDVLRDARIVTAVTGEGLSEYLSRLLRPIVAKEKKEALDKETGEDEGMKPVRQIRRMKGKPAE